jgi:DNA gyrase subunit A
VSTELADVAKRHGTPARTVLLESAGQPATAAVALEVADDPCWVLLSSTVAAGPHLDGRAPAVGGSGQHDVLLVGGARTARGSGRLVTDAGRLVRLSVLDLPALPAHRRRAASRPAGRRCRSSSTCRRANGSSR